jgi:hypothetical protein
MNIELKLEPFHHIIVNGFYDDISKQKVLDEIIAYRQQGKFLDPSQSGSALDENGNPLKKNESFFFGQDEFDNSFCQEYFNNWMADFHNIEYNLFKNKSWFFTQRFPFMAETLISYYKDNDNYVPHTDQSALTMLTWLNKEPKKFTGGDLYFPDFDYTVEYKNNSTIIFYSRLLHEVKPVKIEGEGDNNGRFCITNFMMTDN